jgi:hypothetical protein
MHQNSDNQLVNMIFYLKLLLIEYKNKKIVFDTFIG